MTSGYFGKPLLQKPGIKRGYKIITVLEPEHYLDLLGELPEGVEILQQSSDRPVDFIHLFAADEQTLHNYLPPLKRKLAKDGSLWISWIKGSSGRDTDINGNDVRKLGLDLGLVDVKVCAVDEDWPGLKFIYRKEDRWLFTFEQSLYQGEQ